ncbi:cell division/GTP binding protein, partial [Ramicandelaber brevisporus]
MVPSRPPPPPPKDHPPLPTGKYSIPVSGPAIVASSASVVASTIVPSTAGAPPVPVASVPPAVPPPRKPRVEQFNMMAVGCRGLGKTAFLNTLCRSLPLSSKQYFATRQSLMPPPPSSNGDNAAAAAAGLQQQQPGEFNERLLVTIIDTPGLDANPQTLDEQTDRLVRFLETQLQSHLTEETKVNRRETFAPSTLIHACLYFLDARLPGIPPHDLYVMKRLGTRVNIIPVVAKSDLLSIQDRDLFQLSFMYDHVNNQNNIRLFDFPLTADEEMKLTQRANRSLRARMPFFIMSNEEQITAIEIPILGRKFPWGLLDCMNPKHCDFALLRSILLNSHFRSLRDKSIAVIYEEYREYVLS